MSKLPLINWFTDCPDLPVSFFCLKIPCQLGAGGSLFVPSLLQNCIFPVSLNATIMFLTSSSLKLWCHSWSCPSLTTCSHFQPPSTQIAFKMGLENSCAGELVRNANSRILLPDTVPVGFSSQEYWSGLPRPSPDDLPNPGIKPGSPELHKHSLLSESPEKPLPHTAFPQI